MAHTSVPSLLTPFCHHLPTASTLVLVFGVCNSLLPPPSPAPAKSGMSARFRWRSVLNRSRSAWDMKVFFSSRLMIERLLGWGTPFCHQPRNRACRLDFGGGGLPSALHHHHPRNWACQLDFGGGGLLSVPSTPTTREIEHLCSISWVLDLNLSFRVGRVFDPGVKEGWMVSKTLTYLLQEYTQKSYRLHGFIFRPKSFHYPQCTFICRVPRTLQVQNTRNDLDPIPVSIS